MRNALLVLAVCVTFASSARADMPSFPAHRKPDLDGAFQGLRFGMNAEEARAAAPVIARAIGPDAEWMRASNAQVRVRVDEHVGLYMVELRFANEATALATLTRAWGEPAAPESRFRFRFWLNPERGIRAVLMDGDDGEARLELLPYRPLADVLGHDAFEVEGRAILGAPRDVLARISHSSASAYQLSPTERSSGYIPMRVRFENDVVVSYRVQVDFTYDPAVQAEVPAILERRLGRGRRVEHPQISNMSCTAYGEPATVYACDGTTTGATRITAWTIYVGEAPF